MEWISCIHRYYALTLTTFRLPFWEPAGAPNGVEPPGALGALASVAFIPAFTVSMSMPVESAGEYGDTREAKGGNGSGGTGNRLPPICLLFCFG